jgi:hypothetical protein
MTRAEKYIEAVNAEREAWGRLKSRLPGSPHYDQGVWAAWQVAISDVSKLIDVRRAGTGSMIRPAGRQWAPKDTPTP